MTPNFQPEIDRWTFWSIKTKIWLGSWEQGDETDSRKKKNTKDGGDMITTGQVQNGWFVERVCLTDVVYVVVLYDQLWSS